MRLFRVELRRALTRRMVRSLAAIALVNLLVAGIAVFVLSDTDEGAQAKVVAAAQAEQDCATGAIFPPGSPISDPAFQARWGAPAPELDTDLRFEMCLRHQQMLQADIRQFELSQIADVADSLQGIWIVLALLIGASLIGAEWAANTVGGHLTWEPRRIRSYLTKALAAMIIGGGFLLLGQVIAVAALYPSAIFRGVTDVPPEFWGTLAGAIGRQAVGAALAAGVGFAIASSTRSTVFALGFTFLLLLLDTLIINAVAPHLRRWSLFRNLGGYISGRGVEGVFHDFTEIPGRSPGGAGMVIACYVGVLLAGGSALFKRRDVS